MSGIERRLIAVARLRADELLKRLEGETYSGLTRDETRDAALSAAVLAELLNVLDIGPELEAAPVADAPEFVVCR